MRLRLIYAPSLEDGFKSSIIFFRQRLSRSVIAASWGGAHGGCYKTYSTKSDPAAGYRKLVYDSLIQLSYDARGRGEALVSYCHVFK